MNAKLGRAVELLVIFLEKKNELSIVSQGRIEMIVDGCNLIRADRVAILEYRSIWDGKSGHVLQKEIQ